jgi:hypothetical protein
MRVRSPHPLDDPEHLKTTRFPATADRSRVANPDDLERTRIGTYGGRRRGSSRVIRVVAYIPLLLSAFLISLRPKAAVTLASLAIPE